MSDTAAGAIDHHFDPSTSTGIPNKKLLMWAFLASDCMFFGCLISTHPHLPAAPAAPRVPSSAVRCSASSSRRSRPSSC